MINKKYLKNLRSKELNYKNDFIYDLYDERIIDSLKIINIDFNNILILGDNGAKLNDFLQKRFHDASFTIYDYKEYNSKKNNLNIKKNTTDLDLLKIKSNKYDLILSNLFLNLSNNLETVINKINKSLIPNGLFIATLPAPQNFIELKKAMIETDIQLYKGAYNRFNQTHELKQIIEILKKNNFKTPVVYLDNIQLEYKNFEKLLNDIHFMKLSYYHQDKKNTFEKKNYFKKMQENYYKNKNNKYKLSSIFFVISGWKDHYSQQKPLKPGEAKINLKDFFND